MPRPHPPEFRQRAVQLIQLHEQPIGRIAADLGVSESCLRRWVRLAEGDGARASGGPDVGGVLEAGERAELLELRRRTRVQAMEIEILKRRRLRRRPLPPPRDIPALRPQRTPPLPRLEVPGTRPSAVAVLATLPVKGRAPKTGYSREQFGDGWVDVDHNGCDTRNDVLVRDLTGETFKPGTRDCVVATGTLADPYSGETVAFTRGQDTSTAVQIDHVVALSDAWQKGAQHWDAAKRVALANDGLELLAVDGPLNGQKGDGDAATWLPPNRAYRCAYISRQVSVKATWGLRITAAERDAIAQVLTTRPRSRHPQRQSQRLPLLPPAAPTRIWGPARQPRQPATAPTSRARTPSTPSTETPTTTGPCASSPATPSPRGPPRDLPVPRPVTHP